MKFYKALPLAAVAVLATACGGDSGSIGTVEPGPVAQVRFVNAAPDTGAVNFRFVDKLENLPTFLAVPFRGGSGLYQGIEAGPRAIRVFPLDNTVAGASIRLVDTTFTFQPNQKYTIVYVGRTKAPAGDAAADRLLIIPDTLPTPGAGNIAVRVIHAAPGTGPVDVYIGKNGLAPVTATVAKISNVAYLGHSAFATLPIRPAGADSLYSFAVTAAGSTTPLFTSTPNEPGAPISGSVSAQAGVQISNSVLTVIVFPGATAGTRAATTSNTTAAAAAFLDNIPAIP